ncbi:hypothetical protein PoB_000398500 [Plakobranchus ocellatus]|uniref:Ubiquitin-like domain-containing protein n=1 Tax=Plakobranchus ocellatus TaxID=259542 RepID=A0AAV3Y374_9GAST|nr:hypothetical protein PoB_000398500 [Plakobranchus ocellatus]
MEDCSISKIIYFAVKRLDRNEEEPSIVLPVTLNADDKVSEVTQILRDKLEINSSDIILRLRNYRGSIIPLNGRVTQFSNTHSRPLMLEVVRHFQSVQPNPISFELSQYTEPLTRKLQDIEDRVSLLEDSTGNIHENRKDKVHQEISKLENTVNFLRKRIEEAESIEWNGMFVKNPLW